MPAHAHDMNQLGDHVHIYAIGDGGGPANARNTSIITDRLHQWKNTAAGCNHKHTIKNTGGNEEYNNMPPYYILAYIMKL